jgi:hypothetical protein
MKNIIYTSIILLISISVITGQTINLDQTGDGHTVNIHQIGNNTVNIEHSGNDQSATVSQKGEMNTSDIKQLNFKSGYVTNSNQALITQIGEENLAEITQLVGSDNYGEIGQYGNRNKA